MLQERGTLAYSVRIAIRICHLEQLLLPLLDQ